LAILVCIPERVNVMVS